MIRPNLVSNSGHLINDFIAIYVKCALVIYKLTMESIMGILGTVFSIIVVITIGAIWAFAPIDR